jgi:hypothetical protein
VASSTEEFLLSLVCWRKIETSFKEEAYDPNHLALVPAHDRPEYAARLKKTWDSQSPATKISSFQAQVTPEQKKPAVKKQY